MLSIRRGAAEEADSVDRDGRPHGLRRDRDADDGLRPPITPLPSTSWPETHIVVLPAERIGGAYEEGWAKLRAEAAAAGTGGSFMPRTVNLVTGPSRTADIEQTITLGAHGAAPAAHRHRGRR